MLRNLVMAFTALTLALFAVPAHAAGADKIVVGITVIHAKPEAGGIAPELMKLERYLKKSFPEHNSFKRLSTNQQVLAIGEKGKLTLPNKNELVIEHVGWKDGYAAVHLNVGGLDSTVNVKDGSTFFQAGRGYDGGMIILAFEVSVER